MTTGSIVSLASDEKDPRKINSAIRQLLERNGGKQVNATVATTTDYQIKPTDFLVEVSGDSTVTVAPAHTVPGQLFCVKKVDAAGSTASINASTNTIDGSTSATLTSSYAALIFQSNGTQYDVLAKPTAAGSFLTAANALSELSTAAATARSNIGAASVNQTDFISGGVKTPSAQDYRIIERVPFATTLTSFTAKTSAGTVTALLKINTTSVTGSSISVSTSASSVSPSSSNVMAAGDTLVLTASSPSSASDLSFTVAFTKTLA